MLQRKDGGGNQDRHLFAVAYGFESGPYRHFSLSEAYVAAHKTVHGMETLHVGLYRLGSRCLVRSILEHE